MAIDHALTVLSWYEHLPKEEIPPEHLWEDSEGLDMWWASVEDKREDGRPASRRGDEDEPELEQNELASALKRAS